MAIDIDYRIEDKYQILSNLADKRFVFDGEHIRSLECVLQSIKIVDETEQAKFWQQPGFWCKKQGRNLPWQGSRLLYWKGVPMDRDSDEYQFFLDRLYSAVYVQHEEFRIALRQSGTEELTHSIGSTDPTFTILTQEEFISRLLVLRELAMKKPS